MPPCKLYFRCFLLIPALYVAASWDVAVLKKDRIDFLNNGTSIGSIAGRLKELKTASYDPIDGFLYVSDRNQINASIFRINVFRSYQDSMAVPFQQVVTKNLSVEGLTFEPVTATLFWTTGNSHVIMKLTLSRSKLPATLIPSDGEVVHNFTVENKKPFGIATDACRRTLYWTNLNSKKPTIEMSALDGSDRRIVIDTDLEEPTSVEVDERQRKIYWCDTRRQGYSYRVERSNLDGSQRERMIEGTHQSPFSITVGLDNIYWTENEKGRLWSLSKNSVGGVEPTLVNDSKNSGDVISSNLFVKIDPAECAAMAALAEQLEVNSRKKALILENLPPDAADSKEQPICQNFCVSGTCTTSPSGKPSCECFKGWTGERCEVESCRGHCLNNGKCKLSDGGKARCECEQGYRGARCEIQSTLMHEFCRWYCVRNPAVKKLRYRVSAESSDEVDKAVINSETCNCSEILSDSDHDDEIANENVLPANVVKKESLVTEFGGRTNVIVISTLGALCVILGVLTVYLAAQVLTLRKRPRIRKRYVVHKPSAPFTSRPQPHREQCEITIENCCNMNICETPCFEPEFKASKATFSKTKSEDKRNLIGSMHTNSSQEEDNY